jgi:hypothetical protein
MKILELYQDYHIDHATEGTKHGGNGWVNIPCPFCTGNPGYHLGYNLAGNYYHCWRCGGHPVKKVVSKLLNIPETQARDIILQYGGVNKRPKTTLKRKIRAKGYKYPSGELNLLKPHLNYLSKRNYDPEQLQRTWNLKGTGPVAILDGINYSRRILAPIIWDGKEVSFQTRNLLPGGVQNKLKYMACPKDRELIEHQTILYGNQKSWQRRGICVEGITDVWRFGEVSFGVFGIDYTPRQVREMSRRFDSIAVVFDPDPQAVRQANKLVAELKFRGVEAFRIDIATDPGDMPQDDADHLVKEILTKIY